MYQWSVTVTRQMISTIQRSSGWATNQPTGNTHGINGHGALPVLPMEPA